MEHELYDLKGGPPKHHIWYAELLENLDLIKVTDAYWRRKGTDAVDLINRVIAIFLDRTYDRNGEGSLFPIKRSVVDMRTLDIWYQMMTYLYDR